MARCKHCKQEYEQYEFNNKYCKEIDCQTAKALYKLSKIKAQKEKQQRKEHKEKKESLKTKQDYEKELERVFNKYIRERDKSLPCISCGKKAGTFKLTAGHFYPAGSYKQLRFNEDNVHGQCWFDCNKNRHGNLHEYRKGLIEKIGGERVDKLDLLARESRHYTIPELLEMKKYYKKLIKDLELCK